MYEEIFSNRLYQLRTQKNVSARDMSLSLGQNAGYINSIESGKSFPSMTNFFFICEYLGITPMEFFDFESTSPQETNKVFADLKLLSNTQFQIIQALINELLKNTN